ncbi:nitroreductase [Campylobacter iguaniorum]|uniref:NAD(P)H-dependent oxidoreductase n=1 Tax=Campylobacter iguaniorum TaxID=1244531 RepID=UPI0007C8ACCC|nr:NAD(P)H-dependent oxidoreductase [Campylobacter iguaniorum]ANE35388.1 nitroreductase [Campylobacter iguaniorum]
MEFKEALTFRHACKVFDENKKISKDEFGEILEAGRLAPSAMNMQNWEFEIIKDKELLSKVKKACWDQIQITSASELIVIYAKISELKNDEYIKKIVALKCKSKEDQEAYFNKVKAFIKNNVGDSDEQIYGWSRAQCYLAVQNMMMQAAVLGIDSCPLEGFVESELNKVLEINPKEKRVAILLAFGYKIKPTTPKFRLNLDEIVKYR